MPELYDFDIRDVIVEPSPSGPREVGVVRRTITRHGRPPITQTFDPPVAVENLPPVETVIAQYDG